MPQIDQDVLHDLTGVDVENADIQVERNTGLVLAHVLTQSLRLGPDVRSLGNLGSQDAGVILQSVVVGALGVDGDVRVADGEVAASKRALLGVTPLADLAELAGLDGATLGKVSAADHLSVAQAVLMAGVGDSHTRKERSSECEELELHCKECYRGLKNV